MGKSDLLSWGDMLVIVRQAPEGSAIDRAVNGDWTLSHRLLGTGVDALHVANWQRSADGEKGRNYPKSVLPDADDGEVRYGKDALPYDEMADWLGPAFASLN